MQNDKSKWTSSTRVDVSKDVIPDFANKVVTKGLYETNAPKLTKEEIKPSVPRSNC